MEARRCVPIQAAAEWLGCSRTKVFELLAAGRLKRGHSFGRKTLVTLDSIEALERSVAPRPAPARRGSVVPSHSEDVDAAIEAFKQSLKGRP